MVLRFDVILSRFVQSLQDAKFEAMKSESVHGGRARESAVNTHTGAYLTEVKFLADVCQMVSDRLHAILVLVYLRLKTVYILLLLSDSFVQ